MQNTLIADTSYRQELTDGLIVRWSTSDDTENLAELIGRVFRQKESEPPNEWLQTVVRDFMSDRNPIMTSNDYAVVEDPHKEGNPLVAGVCLLRMDWQYEDVQFPAARPEIVATDPAYRNRGLIRHLFNMVHARSEAEGRLVQAITGIPYFYRQFGYEYALDLDGKKITYLTSIPKAKEGENEAITLRDATLDDIDFMRTSYEQNRHNSLIWTVHRDEYIRHNIIRAQERRVEGKALSMQILVDARGKDCGVVYLPHKRWSKALDVFGCDILLGNNLQALLPSLMRALQAFGQQLEPRRADTESFSEINWNLGKTHPLYEILGSLAPVTEPPYAWYIRVTDLPNFLQVIAPVLERRLAASSSAGYSGELKLDFYRGGLRMVFTEGKITTVEHWKVPTYEGNAQGGVPALVFLKLLFGYRSLDELKASFPEVWADREGEILLNVLFPTRSSSVMIP